MNYNTATLLFFAMAALAAIPSISVFTVSSRAAAYGFTHGAFTALGIVVGDILFILLAIFGLAFLAETMAGLFAWLKYLGGAYLIWLGITLWKSKPEIRTTEIEITSSLLSSFFSGLLITLADQKAIFFYLGFFPAFLDLSAISLFDTSMIILITVFAVGGVKLVYAFLASSARLLITPGTHQTINFIAGSTMITVGIYIISMVLV